MAGEGGRERGQAIARKYGDANTTIASVVLSFSSHATLVSWAHPQDRRQATATIITTITAAAPATQVNIVVICFSIVRVAWQLEDRKSVV